MSDLDSFFAKKDRKKNKKKAAAGKSGAVSANKAAVSNLVASVTKDLNGVNLGADVASGDGEAVAAHAAQSNSNINANITGTNASTAAADGWIELEESKTAQVNTGGRTVATFKRDASDTNNNTHNADGTGEDDESGEKKKGGDSEKFSGWKEDGGDGEEDTKEEGPKAVEGEKEAENKPRLFRPRGWKPAGPDVKSSQQFPSLADAAKANAPEVPQSMKAAAIIGADSQSNKSNSNSAMKGFGSSLTSSSGRPRFINSKRT